MDYSTIKGMALSYADREDDEVISRMDQFFRVVESRINARLRVGQSTKRAVVVAEPGSEYFGLPFDFDRLRDVEIQSPLAPTSRITPRYVSPEVMNHHITHGIQTPIYTLIATQLQIHPIEDDAMIEIVYYARLQELSDTVPNTWLSRQAPDTYIFGLLVEISSFVKDASAAQLWDARFQTELDQLINMDAVDRWSGPSLQVHLG